MAGDRSRGLEGTNNNSSSSCSCSPVVTRELVAMPSGEATTRFACCHAAGHGAARVDAGIFPIEVGEGGAEEETGRKANNGVGQSTEINETNVRGTTKKNRPISLKFAS